MLGRENCVDCARTSPETDGDNTLTTSFGWRLIRVADDNGDKGNKGKVEWRCASCWQKYKAAHAHLQSDATARISSIPPRSPRGSGL
jgi:hypothetical protein